MKKPEESLKESIEELDETLEQSLTQQGFLPTLWRGIVGAIGGVIGTAIAVTLIVLFLQKLTGVPFIGHYVGKVIQSVQQNK